MGINYRKFMCTEVYIKTLRLDRFGNISSYDYEHTVDSSVVTIDALQISREHIGIRTFK